MKRVPASTIPHRGRWLAVATAAAILVGSLAGWASAENPRAADQAKQAKQVKGDDKKAEPLGADADLPPPKPDSVRIFIQTVPPRKAQVKWGGKSLGVIPAPRALVVERPRDSGPMDLVIRAAGFLPVHTRAYTFSDSRVAVKLTPPSEKSKLFGYREDPAPPVDGGVPAGPVTAPVAPPAN